MKYLRSQQTFSIHLVTIAIITCGLCKTALTKRLQSTLFRRIVLLSFFLLTFILIDFSDIAYHCLGGPPLVFRFFRSPENDRDKEVNDLDCQIHLLTNGQKLSENPYDGYEFYKQRCKGANLIVSQADNPIIFFDKFAKLRITNNSKQCMCFYAFRYRYKYDDIEEQHGKVYSFLDRPELLYLSLVVKLEVRDEHQNILNGSSIQDAMYSSAEPEVPDSDYIKLQNFPIVSVKDGEAFDLGMPILGKVRTKSRGLKAGVYSVRAFVSYAEVPSARTVTLESGFVQVVVTDQNIIDAGLIR